MTPTTVGVFGGSFDPPHIAHRQIVEAVLEADLVHAILVVPCVRHVLGKSPTSFEHRLEMCRLWCEPLGEKVCVSRIEKDRELSGYTIDTLEAIASEMPGTRLRLVIGADILEQAHLWKRFDLVRSLAPPIVVARRGHPRDEADLDAPQDVSSTTLRETIRDGRRPEGLVDGPVLDYIDRHGLYRDG